jgi:hypothetical protein
VTMTKTVFAKLLERKQTAPLTTTPRILLVSDLQKKHNEDQVRHAVRMFGGAYEMLPYTLGGQTARTVLAQALSKGCKIIELGHDVSLDFAAKLVAEATFMEIVVIRAVFTKGIWDLARPSSDGGYEVNRMFSHFIQVHSIAVHSTALTAAGE